VRMTLARCQGNKRRACHVLDISYHTLQSYLQYAASSEERGGSGARMAAAELGPGDRAIADDAAIVA